MRALVDVHPTAVDWLARVHDEEVRLCWPTLVYVEVANTVRTLSRAGHLSEVDARDVVETTLLTPAEPYALEALVLPALDVARSRRLTVYDACYVALAESLGAPLVTADRPVAAAARNAVLIRPDAIG